MDKIKVIKKKNLPCHFPILSTAVAYLLLDKFKPQEWVWGAVGLFFLLFWIGIITTIFIKEEEIDIFKK